MALHEVVWLRPVFRILEKLHRGFYVASGYVVNIVFEDDMGVGCGRGSSSRHDQLPR